MNVFVSKIPKQS